jgi:hypothetical protein
MTVTFRQDSNEFTIYPLLPEAQYKLRSANELTPIHALYNIRLYAQNIPICNNRDFVRSGHSVGAISDLVLLFVISQVRLPMVCHHCNKTGHYLIDIWR